MMPKPTPLALTVYLTVFSLGSFMLDHVSFDKEMPKAIRVVAQILNIVFFIAAAEFLIHWVGVNL